MSIIQELDLEEVSNLGGIQNLEHIAEVVGHLMLRHERRRADIQLELDRSGEVKHGDLTIKATPGSLRVRVGRISTAVKGKRKDRRLYVSSTLVVELANQVDAWR